MTGFYEGTDGQQVPVAHDLDEHTDVTITTPLAGDTIVYDDVDAVFKNGPADLSVNVLDNIGDVDAASPSDTQVLAFSTGSGLWQAAAVSSGNINNLGDIIDVVLTGVADGDTLQYKAGQWVNTPFFGNTFVLGDATASTLFAIDADTTGTGKIEFRKDGVAQWTITNEVTDTDLSISNGVQTLGVVGTELQWNSNFTISGANTLSLPTGFVTAVGVSADSYVQLADGATVADTGFFWGNTASDTHIKSLGSATPILQMKNTHGVDIFANTSAGTIPSNFHNLTFNDFGDIVGFATILSVPSYAAGTQANFVRINETSTVSLRNFEVSQGNFVMPEANTDGQYKHRIGGRAVSDRDLTTAKQVQDMIFAATGNVVPYDSGT
jgi:hypothetical protein